MRTERAKHRDADKDADHDAKMAESAADTAMALEIGGVRVGSKSVHAGAWSPLQILRSAFSAASSYACLSMKHFYL